MQETSSTIMLVSFAITVMTVIFNPSGTVATAITNLGTRLAGKMNALLAYSPADIDVMSTIHAVTHFMA